MQVVGGSSGHVINGKTSVINFADEHWQLAFSCASTWLFFLLALGTADQGVKQVFNRGWVVFATNKDRICLTCVHVNNATPFHDLTLSVPPISARESNLQPNMQKSLAPTVTLALQLTKCILGFRLTPPLDSIQVLRIRPHLAFTTRHTLTGMISDHQCSPFIYRRGNFSNVSGLYP